MSKKAPYTAKGPLTGEAATASYRLYPPAGTIENARLYRGANLFLLAFGDMHGRAELSVLLTEQQFERMRAAFPEIPYSSAQGG